MNYDILLHPFVPRGKVLRRRTFFHEIKSIDLFKICLLLAKIGRATLMFLL
jgi:hypothetical protein